MSLLFSSIAALQISASASSSIGSSSLYPSFISISLDLLRKKAVASSENTSTTHIGYSSISQPKSVTSRSSRHNVGVDCHYLATNNACNIWYYNTVTVETKSSGGLLCCGNLSLNILLVTLLTEEQLKPCIPHTNSSLVQITVVGPPTTNPIPKTLL